MIQWCCVKERHAERQPSHMLAYLPNNIKSPLEGALHFTFVGQCSWKGAPCITKAGKFVGQQMMQRHNIFHAAVEFGVRLSHRSARYIPMEGGGVWVSLGRELTAGQGRRRGNLEVGNFAKSFNHIRTIVLPIPPVAEMVALLMQMQALPIETHVVAKQSSPLYDPSGAQSASPANKNAHHRKATISTLRFRRCRICYSCHQKSTTS